MPNFNYHRDVPDGPNNPSEDQPDMKVNTNSTFDIMAEDHFGFKDNNGGWHEKATMVSNIYTLASPPPSIAGQVVLFASNTAPGNVLSYVRDNVIGTATSLTTAKVSKPLAAQNGYSWLPGEILIQWGIKAIAAKGTTTPVLFVTANVDFPNNCFNVQLTVINDEGNSPGENNAFVKIATTTNTGFTITNSSSSATKLVFWVAIGN